MVSGLLSHHSCACKALVEGMYLVHRFRCRYADRGPDLLWMVDFDDPLRIAYWAGKAQLWPHLQSVQWR